jgi:hypothetical protein
VSITGDLGSLDQRLGRRAPQWRTSGLDPRGVVLSAVISADDAVFWFVCNDGLHLREANLCVDSTHMTTLSSDARVCLPCAFLSNMPLDLSRAAAPKWARATATMAGNESGLCAPAGVPGIDNRRRWLWPTSTARPGPKGPEPFEANTKRFMA